MDVDTLEDGFKLGGLVALALFTAFWVVTVRDAPSLIAAVDSFQRGVLALTFAVVPTNEVALLVDLFVALVGGSFVAEKVDFNLIVFALTAGFLWLGTNLIINWFFPPI